VKLEEFTGKAAADAAAVTAAVGEYAALIGLGRIVAL
jgi:hypothetical protein